MVIADFLLARFDLAGAAIITAAAGIVALYFASTFEVSTLNALAAAARSRDGRSITARWSAARASEASTRLEIAKAKAAERAAQTQRDAARN